MSVTFETPPRVTSEVNLTPMVDVVLQLLVFFMLTMAVSRPNLQLDLPRVNEGDSVRELEKITVELEREGTLRIDGKEVPIEQIEPQLRLLMDIRGSREVFFYADRQVPYEEVVRVMRRISEAGALKFRMVYESE